MTEIEKKALALLNEVAEGRINSILNDATFWDVINALYRSIEQHEAYKQEVSDAVHQRFNYNRPQYGCLERFIPLKPVDPLVEALEEWINSYDPDDGEAFRTIIKKRGGKIVWGEG